MEAGLAMIALTSITALVVKTRNHQATERRDNDTIENLKQELNACEESASEARIRYEELKESSNQQTEAVQNAQDYMDSESLRYCSIIQAFEEELAALMDICERKEKMLVTMAEEGERREEKLVEMAERKLAAMSAKCERKEEELTVMACQLADMSQLCQSTEEKMAKLNKAIMTNLVEERLVGQERLESLETVTQLFNNKEEELEAMAARLEMSEKQLAAMSELCQAKDEQLEDMTQLHEATMNNLVAERQLGQERLESLENMTQLFTNKEEELTAMAELCQAKDEQLEDMTQLHEATMNNLVAEQKLEQERLKSLETVTQLLWNNATELEDIASRLQMSEKQLAAMSELCQAKDEKLEDMTQLHEATMNNLVAEQQLGQERLNSLETMTQLLWNNATELEDMSKLCQAKEGQLAEILLVYEVTAENLAKEIEQGEERLDASEEKLEAMTQLCQSQDIKMEDAAELHGKLETVLQQKIKREESQQLAMERIEEGFERQMLESQKALEEERAEAASLRKMVVYVAGQLADLQKPPSPTPTPGCPTVQETLSVEDDNVVPATEALDRDGHGEESQESQKQADPQEQMLAQQDSGVRRRKEKPRWVKMVFGNYRPNRWFTEEQVIHKPRPSSQTQMSSDQRGRGSDARRPGAQGMARRDQGGAGHQRPRPREIEWAQHWRAEYNPYRTVKGAF